MTDEMKRMLPVYGVLALVLAFNAWQWWKRKQLRKAMVAEGRMAEGQDRPRARPWLWTVPVAAASVALVFWLEPRVGRKNTLMLVAGGFFVVFMAVGIGRQMLTRDALVTRANELAGRGKVEEAIAELRAALAEQKDGRRAQALAMILFNAERLDESVEALRVARELRPDDVSNDVMEAMALLKLKRPEAALAVAEKARVRWANDAGLAYLSALALVDLGRVVEAAEQYRQGNELGAVAVEDQRVDLLTRGNLMMMAKKRLDEEGASTRGARAFGVIEGQKGAEGAG